MAQLTNLQKIGSFRVRGVLCGQKIITLIDTSTTHNFIDEGVVARRVLRTEECEGFRKMFADSFTLTCTCKIPNLCIQLGEYELKDDL